MKHLSNPFRSEFVSNLSIQVIGTTIAQLIPFIISPFIARLYPEKSFGVFTLFMAIVAVLVVPNGGRYHNAIVLPKSDRDAQDIGKLSFLITIWYNILLLIVVIVFYNVLNSYYNLNELWYLIPVYVTFFGIYNILLFFSVRDKQFKVNAIAKIIQTFSTSIFTVVVAFFGLLFSGLIIGKLAGIIISIPFLKVQFNSRIDYSRLKVIAKTYIDYPKITILPAFLNIFSSQALVFFIGAFYSDETLGFLGLTNLILAAPLAIIGVSFRDVFYQKIAGYFLNKEYSKAKEIFLGSALVLFLIGGLITIILYFLGEYIFSVIYGVNWKTSGVFAAILSFSFWVKLCVSPLSSIFNATNQLNLLSIWQSLYFFTTIIVLYLSIIYFKLPIRETLIFYVVHEVLLYSIYFLFELKSLGNFKKMYGCKF